MVICDITIKSKKWQKQKNISEFIENITTKIIGLCELKKFLQKKYQLEIMFSLVSDIQIQKINNEHRHKNKPTNVLSFANFDEKKIAEIGVKIFFKEIFTNQNFLVLGDIILAYETIENEALQQNKKFNDHLTHLTLHAILHLIGYDHENDEEAKEMESLEIKILKKLKIKNPYLKN
jgi:probable rRNA maturation factor